MTSPARTVRGVVLFETIVALTVLATVGTAGAWLASESLRAVAHAHEQEQRVRAAERLLTAVSLWPREDLDRHLGRSMQGPWWLDVSRLRPMLYAVSLTDTLSRGVVLRTALFRGDLQQ